LYTNLPAGRQVSTLRRNDSSELASSTI
jgi:hypothetical protein